MHPAIYAEFEAIVARLRPAGPVVEIGAVPNATSLLAMPALGHLERVDVNLGIEGRYKDFKVLRGNGNDMKSLFRDAYAGCVISNATLEHDRFFWRTLSEMRRILRPGGAAILGVPSFTVQANISDLGLVKNGEFEKSALVFRYHGAPKDYYRFSETAVSEVFFDGFADVQVKSIMIPPRTIGCGIRSNNHELSGS
jgi:SAM-dependent methyltransferase